METKGERRQKKEAAKRKMKVHNVARWKAIQEAQQKRAKKGKK